jgi:hypothetical protein
VGVDPTQVRRDERVGHPARISVVCTRGDEDFSREEAKFVGRPDQHRWLIHLQV